MSSVPSGTPRQRPFRRGDMDVLLLHLIAKGPRHGYDLISDIQELAGAQYTPSSGALYPVLRKLAASGMVMVVTQEDSRKYVYELTPFGKAKLEEEPSAVERILTRISALVPEPSFDTGARIRQAFAELGSAVTETADRVPQASEVRVVSQLSSITRLLRKIVKRDHAEAKIHLNNKE